LAGGIARRDLHRQRMTHIVGRAHSCAGERSCASHVKLTTLGIRLRLVFRSRSPSPIGRPISTYSTQSWRNRLVRPRRSVRECAPDVRDHSEDVPVGAGELAGRPARGLPVVPRRHAAPAVFAALALRPRFAFRSGNEPLRARSASDAQRHRCQVQCRSTGLLAPFPIASSAGSIARSPGKTLKR
jgi:hypothetical protein